MDCGDERFFTDHFREALDKGYIHAYYQPIYRSITGKMMCAESLARWIDPDNGMFSPTDFIPVLEQNDLIFDLDMEILRQTCEFYSELKERGTRVCTFSVNLSRQDFNHAEMFDRVTSILERYDVPYRAIKLEITESLMLEDPERFSDVLQKFSDAGFSMWMDDFGSGYSSLNILKNYNFDLMKFDMLFLKDFSLKGRKLLAALINMSKSLGIHTLTEGVEDEEQKEFLIAAGCEALQGFYFSKPVAKMDLITLLDGESLVPESCEDQSYWEQIGHLNFLSTNPLEEYSGTELYANFSNPQVQGEGVPLALIECFEDRVDYIYASPGHMRSLKELGYDSIEGIEKIFNDHRSDRYLLMKKSLDDAIRTGTIRKVDYVSNDVYYSLSIKLLARKSDRAMLALYLRTFDTEREVETAKEMISYSNSLFATYELAVLLYPEKGIANRIYTSNNLPVYDKEATLDMSVKKFAANEVDPVDQERYLRFLDFSTVFERVENSPRGFVQGVFRMRWCGDCKIWHIARLSRVPTFEEKTYILTIQMIEGKESAALDKLYLEYPEMFG